MGYYAGWRPGKEKVMGLVFELDSDQELREKMDSGEIIKSIREYFEQLKAEEELPFATEQLTRANAIDFVEVSSYETSIDYQTYVYPGNRELVDDFRELVLLAYDQVFGSPEADVLNPDVRTVEVSEGVVIVDKYFKSMWETYVESMDNAVRTAMDKPAIKDMCLDDTRHERGRIGGAISYLFLSGAFDDDAYTRLSNAAWDIYVTAQNRIEEVG